MRDFLTSLAGGFITILPYCAVIGLGSTAAISVWFHRRRAAPPSGPPIFREIRASGREVSRPFHRVMGAGKCLVVEVYDEHIRLAIPRFADLIWPIEISGMPAVIDRERLHAAYAKADNILLEFEDANGVELAVELRLQRTGDFLAAIQS